MNKNSLALFLLIPAGLLIIAPLIFALILILYNPIFPVHLTREIWMPINFITSGIYIFGYFKIKKYINL